MKVTSEMKTTSKIKMTFKIKTTSIIKTLHRGHMSKVQPFITFCRHKITDDETNLFLVKFWPVWKKEHFSRSKIDQIRAFCLNLSKFHEKIAKICNKNLWFITGDWKPCNNFIILPISLFMSFCPLFLAQCALYGASFITWNFFYDFSPSESQYNCPKLELLSAV